MYEQRRSPLIAFIFYPLFELETSACTKRILDDPVGLNAFKVIQAFFSALKQPKRRIEKKKEDKNNNDNHRLPLYVFD